MSARQAKLCAASVAQEFANDPFGMALKRLKEIDREYSDAHADFMQASAAAREAFDRAIAGLTEPTRAFDALRDDAVGVDRTLVAKGVRR